MKTLNLKNKLFLFLLTLTLVGCSSTNVVTTDEVFDFSEDNEEISAINSVYGIFPIIGDHNYSIDSRYTLLPKFQNFKKKENPKQSFIIANMIAVVHPEIDPAKRDLIATILARVSTRYNIRPEIFVAIVDTESNFRAEVISSTGDLSMAQINVDVWNKEFKRMGLPVIDKERVRFDLEYTFAFMAEILNVLKIRYETTDPIWYARYHSSTPKYKYDYFKKLAFRLNLMDRSENLRMQIAQIENMQLLSPAPVAKKIALDGNLDLNAILTVEPIAKDLYSPGETNKRSGVLEYAKNFIFDTIRL